MYRVVGFVATGAAQPDIIAGSARIFFPHANPFGRFDVVLKKMGKFRKYDGLELDF